MSALNLHLDHFSATIPAPAPAYAPVIALNLAIDPATFLTILDFMSQLTDPLRSYGVSGSYG